MKLGMKEYIIEVFKGTTKSDIRRALDDAQITLGEIRKGKYGNVKANIIRLQPKKKK